MNTCSTALIHKDREADAGMRNFFGKPVTKTECKLCHKKVSVRRLKLHLKQHMSSKNRAFKCPSCALGFTFKNALSRHIKMNICGSASALESHPTESITEEHARKTKKYTVQCEVCHARVLPHNLKQHRGRHSEERVHRCPSCNLSFVDKTTLVLHIEKSICGSSISQEGSDHVELDTEKHTRKPGKLTHQTGPATVRMIQCEFCHRRVSTISLTRHIRQHTEESEYRCPSCNLGYGNKAALRSHIKKNACGSSISREGRDRAEPVTEERGRKPAKSSCQGKPVAEEHTRKPGKGSFKCKVCHERVLPHSVERHMRQHAKKRVFKCPSCSRGFSFMSSLKSHIDNNICGSVLSSESLSIKPVAEKHSRIPSGWIILQCEVCHRKVFKQHLKRHMRQHSEGSEHRCPLCDLGFINRSALNIHIKKATCGSSISHGGRYQAEQGTGKHVGKTGKQSHRAEQVTKKHAGKLGKGSGFLKKKSRKLHVKKISRGLLSREGRRVKMVTGEPSNVCDDERTVEGKSREATLLHKSDKPRHRKHVTLLSGKLKRSLKCHFCGKVFSSKSYCNKHIKFKKCKSATFKWSHAAKTSEQIMDSLQNKLQGKPIYDTDEVVPSREFENKILNGKADEIVEYSGFVDDKEMCVVCRKGCSSKAKLELHMEEHLYRRIFKCLVCPKKYSTHYTRRYHALFQHKEMEGCLCRICSQNLKNVKELEAHLSKHRHEKMYKCMICSQVLAKNLHLKKHLETHATKPDRDSSPKEKRKETLKGSYSPKIDLKGNKHNCLICRESFAVASQLTSHIKTHVFSELSFDDSRADKGNSDEETVYITDMIEIEEETDDRYGVDVGGTGIDQISDPLNDQSTHPSFDNNFTESIGEDIITNEEIVHNRRKEVTVYIQGNDMDEAGISGITDITDDSGITNQDNYDPLTRDSNLLDGTGIDQISDPLDDQGTHSSYDNFTESIGEDIITQVESDDLVFHSVNESLTFQTRVDIHSAQNEDAIHSVGLGYGDISTSSALTSRTHLLREVDNFVSCSGSSNDRCFNRGRDGILEDSQSFFTNEEIVHNRRKEVTVYIQENDMDEAGISGITDITDDSGVRNQENYDPLTRDSNLLAGTNFGFKCILCTESFLSRNALKAHMSLHTDEQCHICNVCGLSFSQKNVLRKHMAEHGEKQKFKCSVCWADYLFDSDLAVHMKTHVLKPKIHDCTVCGRKFETKRGLLRHLTIHSDNRPFGCDSCDLKFGSIKTLKHHQKEHLNDCEQGSDGGADSTVEMQQIVENESNVTNSEATVAGTYSCGPSPTWAALPVSAPPNHKKKKKEKKDGKKIVLVENVSEGRLICPVCGKQCKKRSSLVRHLTVHSLYRRYACDICSLTFATKLKFHKHQRKHKRVTVTMISESMRAGINSSLQRHDCSVCGKKFKYRSNYVRHLKRHSSLRFGEQESCVINPEDRDDLNVSSKEPIDCGQGDEMNSSRQNLTCTICGTKFSRGCGLKSHMKSHSRHRPFACHLCSNTFTSNPMLKKHLRQHRKNVLAVSMKKKDTVKASNSLREQKWNLVYRTALESGERKETPRREFPNVEEVLSEFGEEGGSLPDLDDPKDCMAVVGDGLIDDRQREKLDSEKQKYTCSICGIEFRKQCGLGSHMKAHSGYRRFACHLCSCTYTTSISLKRHLGHHRINRNAFKSVEGKEISRGQREDGRGTSSVIEDGRSNASQKRSKSNDGKGYFCKICNRTFDRYLKFVKHERMHKNGHRCPVCAVSYYSTGNLAKHMKSHSDVWDCSVCGKKGLREAGFKLHMKMHKSARNKMDRNPVTTGGYISNKEYGGTIEKEESHLIIKGEKKTGESSNAKAHTMSKITKEIKAGTGKTKCKQSRHKCEICGKILKHRGNYSVHLWGHTYKNKTSGVAAKGRRHEKKCSLQGQYKEAYFEQMSVWFAQDGRQVIECKLCKKTMPQKCNFILHMMGHVSRGEIQLEDGPKPNAEEGAVDEVTNVTRAGKKTYTYTCTKCSKIFRSLKKLERHMRSHGKLRNKTNRCSICEKQFKVKWALERHVSTHSENTFVNSGRSFLNDHELTNYNEEKNASSLGKVSFLQIHSVDKRKIIGNNHVKSSDARKVSRTCEISADDSVEERDAQLRAKRMESKTKGRLKVVADTDTDGFTCRSVLRTKKSKLLQSGIFDCEENGKVRPGLKKHRLASRICLFCGKIFLSRFVCNAHIARHSQNDHKCPLCTKSFLTKPAFLLHYKNHESETVNLPRALALPGRKIGTGIITEYNALHDAHVIKDCKVVLEQLPKSSLPHSSLISAPTSSSGFDKKRHQSSGVIDDLKANLIVDNNRDKPFVCRICGSDFKWLKSIKMHMKVHLEQKSYKCKICQKSFPSVVRLSRHAKLHEKKLLTCWECGKAFALQQNLNKHLKLHENEKQPEWESTGKGNVENKSEKLPENVGQGKSMSHTKSPARTVTDSTKMRPPASIVTQNVKGNTRVTSVEKGSKFICPVCGKVNVSIRHLDDHMIRHSNDRPFKCPLCQGLFKRVITLKKHIQNIHSTDPSRFDPKSLTASGRDITGNLPYRCSVCDKGFVFDTTLKVHMMLHTRDRPSDDGDCEEEVYECTVETNEDDVILFVDHAREEETDRIMKDDCIRSVDPLLAEEKAKFMKEEKEFFIEDMGIDIKEELVEDIEEECEDLNAADFQMIGDLTLEEQIDVSELFNFTVDDLTLNENLPNLNQEQLSSEGPETIIDNSTSRTDIGEGVHLQQYSKADHSLESVCGENGSSPRVREKSPKRIHTYCSICDITFCESRQLFLHLLKHGDRVSYKCDVCADVFKVYKNYRIHAHQHVASIFDNCLSANDGDKESQLDVVPGSSRESEAKDRVNEKETVCHKVVGKPFQSNDLLSCDACGETFSNKNLVSSHQNQHLSLLFDSVPVDDQSELSIPEKDAAGLSTSGRPFVCSMCGDVFVCAEVFEEHLRQHFWEMNDDGETFEMPSAVNYVSTSLSDFYVNQEKVASVSKAFTCIYCDKQFQLYDSLRNHVIMHMGERLF